MIKYSGNQSDDILNYLETNNKQFIIGFIVQFLILFVYVLIETIINYHGNTLFIFSIIDCLWTAIRSSIILSFVITGCKIIYNVRTIKKHYKQINKEKSRKKIFKIVK